MPTRYHCQDCGRACHFKAKSRNGKLTGNRQHDLCARCWRERNEAIRARELAEAEAEEEERLP